MTDNTPKISFIPKNSLVREDSFMERKNPMTIMGILSFIVFIMSVGSYAGLYFYGNRLEEENKKITADIINAQSIFSQAPEISKAKAFLSHAEIARGLLDAHIAVSPVIDFIEQSTVSSVLYEKFLFKLDGGVLTLELTGEAPSYASLAYQADVLREKNKELTGFSVYNVVLTKFGTITFSMKAVFTQEYLSYLKTKEMNPASGNEVDRDVSSISQSATISNGIKTESADFSIADIEISTGIATTSTANIDTTLVLVPKNQAPELVVSELAPLPVVTATRSFWLWFKFW